MKIPAVDLRALPPELRRAHDAAHTRVLNRGQFVLGPELVAFEKEFAAFCGVAHCVGVGNGYDALTLALRALGVLPGDEILVPAHTYIATWLAIDAAGAIPRPAPVNPATFNLEPKDLERLLTPRTRGILAVHLYGLPAPMAELRVLAKAKGLFLLEDAAQAHGATLHGVKTGALGDAAAFSFYPTKNLGAFGDGGAVTTNDARVAEQVRRLRNYGESTQRYHCSEIGVNSRLDELQSAFLRASLPWLTGWNERRRQQAAMYTAILEPAGVAIPHAFAGAEPVFHQYVVRVQNRDRVCEALVARGVEARVHYPVAPHAQRCYAGRQFASESGLAGAELLAGSVLSLPIGPHLSDAQVREAAEAVAQECKR